MKKINVAVIGFGMAGREFHMPPLDNNDKFFVKKVMTRNEKNQNDLKEQYPYVEIITSFDEAIKDPSIDLIVIATANDVHYEYTKKALEHKKHVVCEKPFVETYETAKELFELANKNNVTLRVFHNRKYDGDIITLEELIETKDFGRLISFSTRFDRLRTEIGENWRFKDSDMAGIFYDLAPHLVHHAVKLFGLPKTVTNKLYYDRDNAIVDDHFEMRLDYEGGFSAFIGAEMLERNPKPRLELVGLNGTYSKYGYDTPDSASKPMDQKYQDKLLRSEYINNELKAEYIPIYTGKHYLFYENLATEIISNNKNVEDENLALSVILIMEKALESNKNNRTITIPQIMK